MNIFDQKNNFEWRDYIRILKRRKWFFILPFLFVLPLGILKIVMTEPVYESVSTIQVSPSRLLSSSLRRVIPGVIGSEKGGRLKKRIMSAEYLTQLIHRLDLQKDEKVREKAEEILVSYPDKDLEEIVEFLLIKHLGEIINVRVYDSEVIEIRGSALTPDLAFLLVKTLGDIFIDESLRGELESVQSTLRFNDEQMAVFKEKLNQSESNLEKYKRELIFKEVENRPLDGKSLTRMDEAIVAIDITIREKRDYLSYIVDQLKGKDVEGPHSESATIQRLHAIINEKINQMVVLMKRYTWKSAEVIKVNRDINELRNLVRRELETLYNRKYPQIARRELGVIIDKHITIYDLEILGQKRDALIQTLEEFKSRAAQTPTQELLLSNLEEEVRIDRRIYNMFLEQNQGAQIEESMQRADAASRFRIIEPPRKPLEPINAGSRMILLMTIMMGTGLGFGAVYLREFLDKSIRTVQEAEEFFKVPVLGVLPTFSTTMVVHQGRRVLFLAISVIVLVVAVSLFVISRQEGLSLLKIIDPGSWMGR